MWIELGRAILTETDWDPLYHNKRHNSERYHFNALEENFPVATQNETNRDHFRLNKSRSLQKKINYPGGEGGEKLPNGHSKLDYLRPIYFVPNMSSSSPFSDFRLHKVSWPSPNTQSTFEDCESSWPFTALSLLSGYMIKWNGVVLPIIS